MRQVINDLIMALDPVSFFSRCTGWEPDPWQVSVLRGNHKRILLNCSRQSGKSTTAAVLAVHRVIYHPNSLVLLVSPSLRQSAELFRKVSSITKTLPDKVTFLEDNKMSMVLDNGSRVVSLPGSEETVRGYSNVQLIIEDEAARVSDYLYRAIRPMLAVSKGNIFLMSTPFGKRGHFYEEWTSGREWTRFEIPATNCPRITGSFLEEEKNALGEWWFQQEYMCQFVETEDQVFSHSLVMGAVDHEISSRSLF